MERKSMTDTALPEPTPECNNHPGPSASIELSVYEWHTLLDELQHSMRIMNRDNSNAKFLWEKIANKLNSE